MSSYAAHMATHVVNTHEAKTRLSELIREVELGGDVIVARNGTPVARIIPWPPRSTGPCRRAVGRERRVLLRCGRT